MVAGVLWLRQLKYLFFPIGETVQNWTRKERKAEQ